MADPVVTKGIEWNKDWNRARAAEITSTTPEGGTIELQFDPKIRLECMRLAVAGLGPSAPIRLLLLGAEQIEQYVRFGNLPPIVPQDEDKP